MEEQAGGLSGGTGPEDLGHMLQEAIQASKQGDRERALRLLDDVLEVEPDHEMALLWKAGVTLDQQEAMWCLRRVLANNPGHPRARAGLAWLQQERAAEVAPPEEEPGAGGFAFEPGVPSVEQEGLEEPEEESGPEPWPWDEGEEPLLEEQKPGLPDWATESAGEPRVGEVEPDEEGEVPALLETPRLGTGGQTDWLGERLRGVGRRAGRVETEAEVEERPSEPRAVPSVVDQLRSGMVEDAVSPEPVGRRVLGLRPAQWLILLLLLSSVVGLAGIVWFLVMRPPAEAALPPAVTSVETSAREATGGERVQSPALAPGSSGDLTILQIRYLEGDPPLQMVGEVQSLASGLLTDLQVELTLYDGAGEVVLTQTGLVARRLLAPDGRSPFKVVLHQAPPEWARYSVRVVGQPTGQEALNAYPDIVVVEHAARDLGGGRYGVEGEVENRSDVTAEQVEVVATFYAGEDEEMVTLAIADAQPASLAPGERATFALETQVADVAVSGYRLFAQGVRAGQ